MARRVGKRNVGVDVGSGDGFLMRNWKWILGAGVAVLVLVLVAASVFVAEGWINSAKISVTVTPSIATVRVGDYEFAAVGEYRVPAGEYEVEVFAEGFETKTGRLVAVPDETVEVRLFLTPTVGNEDWYEKHPGDALVLGDLRNDAAILEFEALKAEQPILKYVPYKAFNYSLNYEEVSGGVQVLVAAELGFRDAAVAYLQGTGLDLSRWKVVGSGAKFGKTGVVAAEKASFSEYEADLSREIKNITGVATEFAKKNGPSGYSVEVLQVKGYGDFVGVLIKVYKGDPEVYDTYRMVVAKVDGKWQAVTGAEMLLYRGDYGKVPERVLKLVNMQN